MWKSLIFVLLLSVLLVACLQNRAQQAENKAGSMENPFSEAERIVKTEAEWKEQLTDLQYYIVRKEGTERPFTGEYWDNKKEGTYTCVACELPLFSSDAKFRSGTGWPSFYDVLVEGNLGSEMDYSLGMKR
ncbi:MAG: peptide-methionine (R)-S-oxide reductase, partial [Bacteroidota bacterium]